MALKTGLAIFGLVFGVVLALAGIFGWKIIGQDRPAPRTEVRVSAVIIGVIFVVLAILTLTGVIGN